MEKKIKVAVVGLNFGGEFPEIYREHPFVESVALCEQDADKLSNYGKVLGYTELYDDYDKLLQSDVDAIHITTGIPNHCELTLKALRAGKHCACTVPMAINLEDMKMIIRAERECKKNYMMMETTIYGFQSLYVKELLEKGEIGDIQYMRGIHFQDMESWPMYWMGLPPMYYATHAVAPLLYLSKSIPETVVCRGSGVMRTALQKQYGNPYPVETALVTFREKPFVADITRSLFEVAHEYVEGFTIMGNRGSFEWNFERELPKVTRFRDRVVKSGLFYDRGRDMDTEEIKCLNMADKYLPESLRRFTTSCTVLDPTNPHKSVIQGGAHHGSHPYMVNEFVNSIVEKRKPEVDAVTAAYWTAVGVCAHQSAMAGGKLVEIPDFSQI
ncbi:MAG: Gfo/Idh/MocA family oxidoreductase [Eubacteriales bacterium]|nr:Gfo/Idh/MocA family oxidoreductase [Eubacteriales bacterium]